MSRKLVNGVSNSTIAASVTTILASVVLCTPPAIAQNAGMQAKIAQVTEASKANKMALSHYNWQESVTTRIKGEVKKQQLFLVNIGPDGQQQKREINAQPDQASGGPLKRHIVAKKKAS